MSRVLGWLKVGSVLIVLLTLSATPKSRVMVELFPEMGSAGGGASLDHPAAAADEAPLLAIDPSLATALRADPDTRDRPVAAGSGTGGKSGLFSPTDVFLFALGENPFEPKMLSITHASVVGTGLQADLPGDQEAKLRSHVAMAHWAGLRYTGLLSTLDPFGPEVYQHRPDLLKTVCIDVDGNRMSVGWEDLYWHSTAHPDWRRFLLETARRSVDSGVDGIFIDEWPGNLVAPHRSGCFDGCSIEGFREYLKGEYTVQELAALGIKAIDSFDYGDFIRVRYLSAFKERPWEVPLLPDFEDYQMESVRNFMHDLISQTRAYARAQGRDIYFTANTAELLPIFLPIQDELDYLTVEFTFPLPPQGRSIPAFKLATSLGKPALFVPQSVHNPGLLKRDDLAALMKMYTAEAYSSGAFLLVPYELPGRDPQGWGSYTADIDELSSYYAFLHNNDLCYAARSATTQVAVLYPYASARRAYDSFADNFYGISNLMLDAHFQYDVLFAGDDEWIDDTLGLEALNRYEVVVLPSTRNVSERQVDLLLAYVEAGGSLFAFGEIGSRDEEDRVMPRQQLGALLVEGSQDFGLGRFVYVERELGVEYLDSQAAWIRHQVGGVLGELIRPAIQTSANENVALLAYWGDETQSTAIHMINYNYDPQAKALSLQSEINMEVELDARLLGRDLGVYANHEECPAL